LAASQEGLRSMSDNVNVIKDGLGWDKINTERGLCNTLEQRDGRIQTETIKIARKK
jgi:hypothetical protein